MKKPYQISKNELKTLQAIELEMLLEVDRICQQYDIKYSLDGGTLLGAVRHKGFIPWDDDVDVIMLREEYQKFRSVCQTELDTERFFLQDYQSDAGYRWGYAKMRRNHTEFVRYGQEHLKQHNGIFLDIFVVDNVPDGWLVRRLHHGICFLIRKGLYSEVGKERADGLLEKTIYRALYKIPRDTYFRWRNALAKTVANRRTKLISHYTLEYPPRCRYGLPRECFDEMRELEFEGHRFSAFQKYDLYLRSYYGDYMRLPPKSERVPHLTVSKLVLTEPKLP